MGLSQKQIDYVPHSRPKRYYIVESQFRSGVQPDSFQRIYDLPRRPRISKTVATLIVFFILMCGWGLNKIIFG